jgi:hypothetical protein
MSQIKPANSVLDTHERIGSDTIWLHDPTLLIKDGRYKSFFPSRQMSRAEAFNAGSRLIIYLSLILYLYSQRVIYLCTGIGSIVIGWVWYKYYPNLVDNFRAPTGAVADDSKLKARDIHHHYVNSKPPATRRRFKYVKPSDDNPFMNVMPSDYTKNPNRASVLQQPCSNFQQVQRQVDQKFHQSLFKDVGDVFGKDSSQRQFYTTPNTAIPNDQDTFARWLYKSPEDTCKQGQCEAPARYIGR